MKVAATLLSTKRLQNSRDGNPRFRLTLDSGAQLDTAPDSTVNYDVQNLTANGDWDCTYDTKNPEGIPVHLIVGNRGVEGIEVRSSTDSTTTI